MSEELEKLLTEKLKQFQMLRNKTKRFPCLQLTGVILLSKRCL